MILSCVILILGWKKKKNEKEKSREISEQLKQNVNTSMYNI